MSLENEWTQLAETWRSQPAPGIDLDAVRREARQRGRSLRLKFWSEIAVSVLFTVGCAYMVLRAESDLFERLLFGGMGGFLLCYKAFMLWLRRGELSEAGLDVQSLVDLELRRAQSTLSYWRAGMWSAMAVWGVLYVVMMVGLGNDWPRQHVAGLAGGLIANILLLPGLGAFGLWRCRQERARIQRYRDLQEQLRAP
ncbi:hypothetical protein [Arenimonas sp. MALMAid1274]|uniref:hypothetical protein n=1 Tax=Arenimonas sp. MALMAid1274 TaxID=3411630 RepID=UPI003B9F2443